MKTASSITQVIIGLARDRSKLILDRDALLGNTMWEGFAGQWEMFCKEIKAVDDRIDVLLKLENVD